MSNVFTLDDLNEAITNKYAPLVFQAGDQEFTLQSLIRIPSKVRVEVEKKLDDLGKSKDENDTVSEDQTLDTFKFVVSSVTKDNKGRALVRLLGDDLAKYIVLIEKWQEATQPGEAPSSQD